MGGARRQQESSAPAEAAPTPTMRPAETSPRPARAEVWHTMTPEFEKPRQRFRWSRTRKYTIGAIVFLLISAAGYIGFREYIYGDDAPPIPVLDDLTG